MPFPFPTQTIRLRQQWESDSSISPDRLRVLIAGREIADATTFLGYLVDLARQLICLHRLGIVHADVKLQNVVILNGRAFLIDLGMSVRRPHGELYSDAYLGGSDLYRAPECMEGLDLSQAGRASATLDMYAAALVIEYAMSMGCGFDITRVICHRCPEMPAVLRGMLSTDPGQRLGPAGMAVAFEGMHAVLLSASADLDAQAMSILEQVEIADTVAGHCSKQLSSLHHFATSRASLRAAVLDTTQALLSRVDLRALWLLWDEVGCAAQLPTYMVGIATSHMLYPAAFARVQPMTVCAEWVSQVGRVQAAVA